MKKFLLLFCCLFLIGATTQRAGWSYSGTVKFTLKEACTVILFHDEKRAFPYEDVSKETPIAKMALKPGNYMLTVEGYYFMELE